MPNFRRGADAMRDATAKKSGGKFNSFIRWGKTLEERTKYIQFVTPLDEMPTVQYHDFIAVGQRDNGKFQYESFISRRDRELDGLNGYDPIHDVWGQLPRSKSVAVAVELEAETTGKKVKSVRPKVARTYENKDGVEVDVPAVGFIVQSPFNFFTDFWSNYEDSEDKKITEVVWKIIKSEDGKTYSFVPLSVAPYDLDNLTEDFPGATLPDLDTFLEESSDEAKQRELLEPLVAKVRGAEDPWDIWPLGNVKYRPEKWDANRKKGLTGVVSDDDPPFEVDEAPTTSRKSRFDDLRKKVEA